MEKKTLPAKASRSLSFEREAIIDVETRTARLAFSSEQPYARSWGIEILDHSPAAVDFSRLLETRPLLRDHNPDKLIGTIESIELGDDRVARAVVRFGRTEEANDAWLLVQDGILRCVSVGYQINEIDMAQRGKDGEPDTYRVKSWTPHEISLVSIPADVSVGIGRAEESAPTVEIEVAGSGEEITDEPAEKTIPDIQIGERSMSEQNIVAELATIAEQYRGHGAMDMLPEALRAGKSVAQFQADILDKIQSKPSAPASEIGLTKKEEKSYSVLRLMRALADPTDARLQREAAYELDCHRAIADKIGESKRGGVFLPYEIQKRDISVGANGGANLVATNNMSFIDLLRNRSRVVALGARTMSGLQGNVTIPKHTAAATAYWLANETTAITESQQTIGQLALSPKNVGAYTEVSRQLMVQSSPDAEQMVMNDLAAVIALAIDKAALDGNGSGAPVGIVNTVGIGSVVGTSLDYAKVLEFQTDIGNALTESCAYLTTPAVAALLAQRVRFSGTDTPLWQGGVLDGTVSGFRATSTAQMAAASMMFGDFSQVIIADWGVIELATNPYASFAAGITGVRAWATVDVGIRNAGAFSLATTIT